MKLRDHLPGDGEGYLCQLRLQWLHVVPADEVVRETLLEKPHHVFPTPFNAEPAHDAPHSHINSDEDRLCLKPFEFYVIHPDDLCAVRVDDLLVEDIPYD